MSRERDEEEEDECFQDSLDRLLSSTASSCSPSSDDEDEGKDPNSTSDWPNCAHQDRPLPVPKFRMGVSNNYDVWISEPSSVEERRIRLLLQMGLSRDPFLSSQNPSISAPSYAHGGSVGSGVFGRSVSSYHLNRNQQHGETSCASDSCIIGNSDPGIVRSRSDGSKDRNCPHQRHKKNASVSSSLFNYNSSSVYPSEILLINSPSVVNETFDGGVLVNNNRAFSRFDLRNGNGSPTTSAISLNKPPSGKGIRRDEQVITDSLCSIPVGNCNSSPVSGGGAEMEDSDSNGVGGLCHQVCTIKNLDDGKQFVVNEVREDGMWNKLKEVSTGRQLTMDEFEMCVGHSPIVQELMRRQNAEDVNTDGLDTIVDGSGGDGSQLKKRGSWLKSIRSVASSVTGHKERRGSDEKDTSSEKGGRRSSSATDDSQDVSYHGRERIRVRQYGKSSKNLTSVYKIQDIQAHNGSIWTIKFSLDGKYLASAGEDCDIHVWKVLELEKRTELLMDKQEDGNFNFSFFSGGSPEPTSLSPGFDNHPEKRRRGRSSINRKLVAMEHIMLPDTVFALSEKPTCSLQGHVDDVLDLSWSKSQELLSSSMDKTVRLWNIPSKTCLKIFSHSDYVTCIQFNPVDDRYFISGSLDAKVRIWSIPACQVVDWNDVHEMVTAACYTPDGQGALVGSYKGSCHLYNISDNKLQQKSQINLQNKKKKGHHKKITGFQFAPGSTSEVLITSADSRIRVVDGLDLVHKFKGFRNTNSQISASFAANGKYVVSASEDSHVYVWKHEGNSRPSRSKGATVTQYYEHFHCQDVSVAITWPGVCDSWESQDLCYEDLSGLADHLDEACTENHPPTPVEEDTGNKSSSFTSGCSSTPLHGSISSATNSYFYDRISATWPEEKLLVATKNHSPHPSADSLGCVNQSGSAWGLVIVTASLRGEIRTFQNFGFPVRL